MQFPKVSSLYSFSKKLTSATPSNSTTASPVGAGVTDENLDQFYYHDKFLKWINETKHKLPRGTPKLRKEAFLADPLVKGTVFPYLRNTILKGGKVYTVDNKLYSEAVTEITDYLENINLLKTLREDFLDLYFLTGHSYRRTDPDTNGNINRLEKIEPSSVVTYTDPWDSSIIAYHQHATINTSWSDYGSSEIVDSWFVPFTGAIKNIYDTYVEGRILGNSDSALYIFNSYKEKYNITTTQKLRIASSERVIAMHHAVNFKIPGYDDDDLNYKKNNYAPIDSVILAIFLKRLLLVSSPNLVFAVLNPFLHATMGILKDVKDANGNPKIISSNPDRPASSDPIYAANLQKYNDFMESFRKLSDNVMKNFKEGGVLTTGPDIKLSPIESSRNVTHQFIKGLIDQLDDEICYNFGLPKALISSKGAELATSRTVAETYNSVHAGERIEYEAVANKLIKDQFAGKTWVGTKIEKDEDTGETKEVAFTYNFEDVKAHYVLDTLNTKDLLQEAQTFKTKAEGLVQIKTLGAGKEDMQALCEENDLGLLGLDNFGAPINSPEGGTTEGGAAQINAILKGVIFEALQNQKGVSSASPTDPSGFKDKKITDRLKEAYQTAKETIDQLFEEH